MNTKLLASIAVFVLLAAIVSISMADSAFAMEEKKPHKDMAMEKKDAKKAELKAKKDDKKAAIKEKKDTKKAELKAKKDAMKEKAMAKKDAMKEKAMAKKDAMKEKAMAKKDAATGTATDATTPSGAAATEVTVDMAKGTGSNTECGDQCFVPNAVKVAKGGKITWTNSDSIQHTASASDGSFDTGLVNGGQTGSVAFNTAGTYDYIACFMYG